MDRSLDEIVAESQQRKQGPRPRGRRPGRGGRQPREHDSYPRDGIRKSTRDDSRSMDTAWVHDRFEDSHSYGRPRNARRRDSPERHEERGTKIKVENLHYELTEDDLDGLFNKIGPVVKLELLYDRAGRSDGTAFVTYDHREDALEAIREFNGANAKGQPIRLSLVTPAPRRNPFDSAHMPGRPLAERITRPRSLSPPRRSDNDRGVDRYVPGRGSRSPLPRRRGGGGGGRRPGARREAGSDTGPPRGRDGRPRKTAEELDAEMADYFNPSAGTADAPAEAAGTSNGQAGDDVDMIE